MLILQAPQVGGNSICRRPGEMPGRGVDDQTDPCLVCCKSVSLASAAIACLVGGGTILAANFPGGVTLASFVKGCVVMALASSGVTILGLMGYWLYSCYQASNSEPQPQNHQGQNDQVALIEVTTIA